MGQRPAARADLEDRIAGLGLSAATILREMLASTRKFWPRLRLALPCPVPPPAIGLCPHGPIIDLIHGRESSRWREKAAWRKESTHQEDVVAAHGVAQADHALVALALIHVKGRWMALATPSKSWG
jgi:hypothetical protein